MDRRTDDSQYRQYTVHIPVLVLLYVRGTFTHSSNLSGTLDSKINDPSEGLLASRVRSWWVAVPLLFRAWVALVVEVRVVVLPVTCTTTRESPRSAKGGLA